MTFVILLLSISYILLFLFSLYLKDNSIADIFWGFGFVIIVWTSFLQSSFTLSQTFLTLLVTAWGLRLTLTIGSKKLLHAGEDKRYVARRQTWKYFKLRSFFQVYVLQMILMLLVATPILILNLSSGFEDSLILSILGSCIALFGLLYETVADTELRIFMQKKTPGEILTFGLRQFHRYPQYFGESIFWLGISIIALQVSIVSLLGWVIITILVCFVSGIPLLEKRYERDENYKKYSKKTPLFFPKWNTLFYKK